MVESNTESESMESIDAAVSLTAGVLVMFM